MTRRSPDNQDKSARGRLRSLRHRARRAAPEARSPREWIASGYAGDMTYLARSLRRAARPVRRAATRPIDHQPGGRLQHGLGSGSDGPAPARRQSRATRVARTITRSCAIVCVSSWSGCRNRPEHGLEAFSCVDDGPVQERVYAEQAGLGWIGKNTCVINPQLGSWMFLAEMLTNLDLEADAPAVDQCGTCTRCLDACPTGAIVEPYTVDATRCLSYLTIETVSRSRPRSGPAMGPQVYGCDICQDVCPWNRRAADSADPAWQPRPTLQAPTLIELCVLLDDDWRALLETSAMRRAGLRRIRRSLAFAAAHLPAPECEVAADALTAHPSAADADVAEAIAWARGRASVRSVARQLPAVSTQHLALSTDSCYNFPMSLAPTLLVVDAAAARSELCAFGRVAVRACARGSVRAGRQSSLGCLGGGSRASRTAACRRQRFAAAHRRAGGAAARLDPHGAAARIGGVSRAWRRTLSVGVAGPAPARC